MKKTITIIAEVLGVVGVPMGLCATKVISLEIAITIGILGFIFILCFIELKKSIDPITNATCEMQRFLSRKWKFVPLHELSPAGYVQENSPLGLTALGKELLEKSGAKKMIEDQYKYFEELINKGNHKTALDVQSCISSLIAEKENENFMMPIKDFAYKNPHFDGNRLTFSDIQRTMVICLRDLYFKNHPEIKI